MQSKIRRNDSVDDKMISSVTLDCATANVQAVLFCKTADSGSLSYSMKDLGFSFALQIKSDIIGAQT